MTEEIDSIMPVGASSSPEFSGSRVDVMHAPQPIAPGTPLQRLPSSSPVRTGSASGSGVARISPEQAAATLQDSVERINARLAGSGRVLQLRVDAETGITIAEIRNSTTGQIVQQIPGADVVHLAEMLSSWAHGKNVLVDLIA